ncbi:MAG: alpha/beta hydrolase [Bacteroidota bacterium]
MKRLNTHILIVMVGLFVLGCSPYKNIPVVNTMDDLTYPFEVKKIKIRDDVEMAYMEQGSGSQTIIFIHGLGSYGPAWKKNVEMLSKQYRCIAVDLPGYGKSSKGNYEGSMAFFAEVLRDFIDALSLDKVTLVGHSMGGQISIVTSLFYPEKIEKLVLIAPAGFETFDEGEKDWFRSILTARAVQVTPPMQIEINFAYNFYDMPDDAQYMIKDRIAMRSAKDFEGYCYIIPQCVRGMVDQPVFEELSKITQPTLIIFGDSDNLIPNRFLNGGRTETIAKAGHEQIKDSKLVMVPKAGHFVMYEKANVVNQEIATFLQ